MILHCPSCGACYDVPAEAAADPGGTFRCTNCETMFGPAEGLTAPAPRSSIESLSSEGGLPPSRGLAQATEGVATVSGPGAIGPRALPPSNLTQQSAGGVSGFGQPPTPGSVPVQRPPGGGLSSGFRDGVSKSQAPMAMTGTETIPRKLDSLPVSRGVRFDSQAARAVPSSSSEMALPAPEIPVQPVDAEAFFGEDDADESSGGNGGFGRARTGLRVAAQRGPSESVEIPSTPVISGFGVPALGDVAGPADVQARQPVPAGHDHAAAAFAGAAALRANLNNAATVAAPAAPPFGSASSLSAAPQPAGRSFSDTGAAPAQPEDSSTVFRLSDLDGESGIELDPELSAMVRRAHTADVEISPKRVTQQIDPLVEFHDVFEDIRRAETGDNRSASERYFDTGLFSGVEKQTPESEEKARLEREVRDARMREGRLDLKAGAGGLAQRIEREVGLPDSSIDESDDMLAAALAESGLREPSTDVATVREEASRAAVVDLDVAGESAGSSAFPSAARYLTVLLVFVLAAGGLLGFIASKNGGLLDLASFDQMLGVAFKGEAYVPRHQSVVQIIQSAEGWVEEPLDGLPQNDGNALAVGDLVGGQYEAGHGAIFTLIDGTITNTTDRAYRSMAVEVSLTTESGDVVAAQVIPAGVRIDQPLLEEILDPERLQAEYERLGGLLVEVELAPTDVTTFSAAFILADDVVVSELTSTARVVGAERAQEARWGQVTFLTPDAVDAPAVEE